MSLELKEAISKLKGGATLKFLLVKKLDGEKEPMLLLDMGKPKLPKGVKKVAEGIASFDGDTKSIVLVTANDGDAEKQGIKALKHEGFASQKLVARKPAKGEMEAVATDGVGDGTPPTDDAPPELSGLMGEILAIKPDLDRALASGLGRPEVMTKYFERAKNDAETGNEAGARKSLSLVTALINEAMSESESPPTGKQDGGGDPLQQLLQQIAALKPEVDRAVEMLPDQSATLLKYYEKAGASAQAGDVAKAQKVLELVTALIQNAVDPEIKWQRDIKATVDRLVEAQQARGNDLSRVNLIWEMAQGKAEVKDYDKAYGLLHKLERELAALSPPEKVETEPVVDSGQVEAQPTVDSNELAKNLQKALGLWTAALALAQAKMAQARQAILADEDFKGLDESEWGNIKAGAAGIDVTLQAFNGLDAALAAAEKAANPEPFKKRAQAHVTEYRKRIQGNELYAAIDQAYGLGVESTISSALAEVESLLAG